MRAQLQQKAHACSDRPVRVDSVTHIHSYGLILRDAMVSSRPSAENKFGAYVEYV